MMKLKEYQSMIYVNLRSVNLPATVTNKRSHVGQGSADDLIKQYENREISTLAFVSKVSYRYKKKMSAMFPLRCARPQPRWKCN
jgi:hypothetical protein